MPRNENSRGSIDRRSIFHPLDSLIPLRESQWPLVEVRRPLSVRIVSTPILLDQSHEVPYVPTSEGTVKRMLEIADVGPEDVVYDLGCGDGRILIMAAEKFNARKAVGYEIRKDLYKAVLQKIESHNLTKKVTIINGDLFNADISEATVITLYLTYGANKKLKPKLERDARPGTKIVSHNFEIPGWQPTRKENYQGDTIYLYKIPDSSQALETNKKLNTNILKLQKILHMDYLDLENVFTHMYDGQCIIIHGKYVYCRGYIEGKTIISVWTKFMEETGAKCLFNAPVSLSDGERVLGAHLSRRPNQLALPIVPRCDSLACIPESAKKEVSQNEGTWGEKLEWHARTR
ncbi:MAG: SAM-dependent methyltransferase [Candidatus Bathyarchaeaceae archaeon]